MRLDIEKFLNENGLKIGDKIIIFRELFEIIKVENEIYLKGESNQYSISPLYYFDFEPVKPKKKIGDTICTNVECEECPLYCIRCKGSSDTLRENLEEILGRYPQLEAMRDYFENELNKEVED